MSVRDALEKAIEALSVKYIYLNASNVITSENFEREADSFDSKYCQYYDHCGAVTTYELGSEDELPEEGDSDELHSWVYKYTYHAGVRLVEGERMPEVNPDDVMVEITASFDAFYTSNEVLSDESAQVFGDKNVKFHIWPYWREFVQNTCGRVGLVPALEVPTFKPKCGVTLK